MRIDPRQLDGRAFDVIVIGAGIQGAALAREATMRGLSTLLVDARDIAAGTSSRSSRLVHGGLRYLRHGHIGLVKEALQERERLLRSAPHLVRPQPMLMPFYPDSGVSSWKMRFGSMLYSKLAGSSTLPRPRRLSSQAAAAAFPGLRTAGLKSALEFYDARTQDARLTLANVVAAVDAGCALANHAEVCGVDDNGLQLLDRLSGESVSVRSKAILNAAGPAVDTVRNLCRIEGQALVRLTRGSHIVLPARAGELALAAFLPDQRIQFVIPHDGGTLCGTTDVDDELQGDEVPPPVEDLDYLREALGFVLEAVPDRQDVKFAFAGWRALPRVDGPPGSLNREAFVVSEASRCGSFHTVVGGKLTTHRSFAERVIVKLFGVTGPSPTRTAVLPGGDGPREVDDPLWWRHGSRVREVRDLILENSEFAQPLCPHRPFLIGELVHALRKLSAVTFADVMLRRLVHVLGPCADDACLQRAHSWFVRERQWPVDEECALAIQSVHAEIRGLSGDLDSWRDGVSGFGDEHQQVTHD